MSKEFKYFRCSKCFKDYPCFIKTSLNLRMDDLLCPIDVHISPDYEEISRKEFDYTHEDHCLFIYTCTNKDCIFDCTINYAHNAYNGTKQNILLEVMPECINPRSNRTVSWKQSISEFQWYNNG